MQIIFDEKQQIFHLYNEKISYVIQVEKQRYLKHCYYGKRLKKWRGGICQPVHRKRAPDALPAGAKERPHPLAPGDS